MAIERDYAGKITFLCDSCSEIEPTEIEDFNDAWALAKREGWRSRKIADEWIHTCPRCKT